MGKIVAGFTLSADGFISDQNGGLDALYPDLESLPNTEPLRTSIQKTGAVVIGRNAFSMTDDPDWYAGNYEYQVPMFVLTHEPPKTKPKETDSMTFTFVTDGIKSAVEQATAAANGKDVTIIGGAATTRQCIEAGLVDELHIDIMPVILGGGLRPFEGINTAQIQLERIKTMELPAGRTHLEFRVIK